MRCGHYCLFLKILFPGALNVDFYLNLHYSAFSYDAQEGKFPEFEGSSKLPPKCEQFPKPGSIYFKKPFVNV